MWADAEDTLGDSAQAADYRAFAARLKASFNRPIAEGGFWDPTNQWYAYWRDKDGSIHGNNLVTPVNFAAIAYGLCDDAGAAKGHPRPHGSGDAKGKSFLLAAQLFSLSARTKAPAANFPFPNYENGDLFLSWGELGVRAYAAYDPGLALKYVKKDPGPLRRGWLVLSTLPAPIATRRGR